MEQENDQERVERQPETVITLENQYGRYQVAVKRVDLSLTDTMNDLVIPLLMASGYSSETIENLLAR
ncbi:MAG TPA: hypothetical protein VFL54_09080 [Gammaproteobacteria bacterium]|nr:hypothetical protein [Gammaproteobacteria bacterium]